MTAPSASDSSTAPETLQERLREFAGRSVGPPMTAPDAVNQAMIRHWVEAMGDENPVYLDAEAARQAGFTGVVAPATMLQAWIMRGYKATVESERARAAGSAARAAGGAAGGAAGSGATDTALPGASSAQDELFSLLDHAGFTSVVATNCEQEYRRPLVIGDRLTASSVIESVSDEKHTALGDGHFVTSRTDFTDQHGALVATMRFRILRFRPRAAAARPAPARPVPAQEAPAQEAPSQAPRMPRPRPAVTQDSAFFFEGAAAGKLLIQRCSACGVLRHPPRPACPECRSFEWDSVESTGRGTVYSYVVMHHPKVPAFDYPLPIALVELEEGTRLVADMIGVEAQDVHIGMPVEVDMVAVDDELTLPMFRPVA